MDSNSFATIAGAAARHGLTLVAGYLVGKGVINDSQGPELVGLGMAAVAFGWSWLQKHNANKTLQAAIDGVQR